MPNLPHISDPLASLLSRGVQPGMDNKTELFFGARVRMSKLGRERHPKYGDREGIIVGRGSPSSWRVKFDDRKTIQAIHRDYLEAAPRAVSTTHSSAHRTDRYPDRQAKFLSVNR